MANPANPYFRWFSGGLTGIPNAGMLSTDGFAYEGGDLGPVGAVDTYAISFGVGSASAGASSISILRAQAELATHAGKFLVRR